MLDPTPRFDGRRIVVTYADDVRNARNLAAGIAGTVKYATDHHLDTPGLIERIVGDG